MKNRKTYRILTAIICIVMAVLAFPVYTGADIGPKESVRIHFINMGDELCYGTLLSETESTGPHYVWDGDEDKIQFNDLDSDVFMAFAGYEDTDGFNFLQIAWKVSETKEIAWTYYPPHTFKILLYYPETQTFTVSDICKKYAFDTYYTVNMEGQNFGSLNCNSETGNNGLLTAYRSYNYTLEILSLISRILLTIAVEMVVAWFFGFKKKRQIILLVSVNTATQIILNVLLNINNFINGESSFVEYYVLLELVVFAIEAVIYCMFMDRQTDKPQKKSFYIIYALTANGISFVTGLVLAHILPGIF